MRDVYVFLAGAAAGGVGLGGFLVAVGILNATARIMW